MGDCPRVGHKIANPNIRIALAIAASAILVFACKDKEPEPTVKDPETTPTQISHDHRIINSENGKRTYRFETPLLERYELAKNPFMEFTKGFKIETFDDSLRIESDLVADYGHFDETKELWTARGNVIAHNYKDNSITLYTERLYWDQAQKRIYSDTTAKVIDGASTHIGRNFEADEDFKQWSFRNTVGQLEVDAQPKDSTSTDSTTTVAEPTEGVETSEESTPEPTATPQPTSIQNPPTAITP